MHYSLSFLKSDAGRISWIWMREKIYPNIGLVTIVVWYIWSCSWKYFFWEIKHKFWEIFRGQAPLSIYTSKQINRWYIDFSVPKTKTWKREVTPRPLKDGLWVPPPPKTKCCSATICQILFLSWCSGLPLGGTPPWSSWGCLGCLPRSPRPLDLNYFSVYDSVKVQN